MSNTNCIMRFNSLCVGTKSCRVMPTSVFEFYFIRFGLGSDCTLGQADTLRRVHNVSRISLCWWSWQPSHDTLEIFMTLESPPTSSCLSKRNLAVKVQGFFVVFINIKKHYRHHYHNFWTLILTTHGGKPYENKSYSEQLSIEFKEITSPVFDNYLLQGCNKNWLKWEVVLENHNILEIH